MNREEKPMDSKVRVALVYPYFRTHSANELLFPPLGIAALASQLRLKGIETKIFDCTFGTFDWLRESLCSYGPQVVGIYCMITLSRTAFRISEMVRRCMPECLLVAGGPLPTLYPEHFSPWFDAVFRGEADLSFPRFCHDALTIGYSRERLGELTPEHYNGLFIRRSGLQIDIPAVHFTEDEIRPFPHPFRGDFDHGAYQNFWAVKDGTATTTLMTTLGCPFKCDFCSKPVFGNLFRRRCLDSVFEEIRQIRLLGYDNLWIADDNFTLDSRFLEEFCFRSAEIGIAWSCLSRVTGLDRATVRLMKRGGCRRVYLGLETGSEATLRLMNKQATLDEGTRAVHLFHSAGIEAAAFFMVGYPGETEASIEATFRFALELPLDTISFNIPFPLPGSRLFERVSGLDETMDWNEENEVSFVYNSEFDPDWLRSRIQRTMREFEERKQGVQSGENPALRNASRQPVAALR
jgi:anaerobic magnesium-protoporphyrin IX monomethyl ester cyclase